MEKEKTYIGTKNLMEFLGISRSTVVRLRAKGMPCLMVGAVWRYPKNQVVSWLEENEGD